MVNYDPKSWFAQVVTWEGTVLPAVIGRVLFIALLAVLVCGFYWLDRHYIGWGVPSLNQLGHMLIGIAVGLMVVFRTNASYDRFWEGRKMWGNIVNTTRNLARSAAAFAPPAEDLGQMIVAYPRCLTRHLRGERELPEVESLLPPPLFLAVRQAVNPPSQLALAMSWWIADRLREGRLSPEIARHLESQVAGLLDAQGACERILKTPIPFVYAVHIKHLLLIYLASLPFVLIPLVGWLTPLVVAAIAFGLLGIEEAGVEIEDPFGTDPNDLPLESICETIEKSVRELVVPPSDPPLA